jgi:hypothetical protein
MKTLLILAAFAVLLALLFRPWDPDRIFRRLKKPADPPQKSDDGTMPQALIQLLHIEATYSVPVDPRKSPFDMVKDGAFWKRDADFDPDAVAAKDRAPRVEIDVEEDPFGDDVGISLVVTDLEMHLVTFQCAARTDDVLEALTAHFLRPATASELLAFGAEHRLEQPFDPIAALGTPHRADGQTARFAAIHSVGGRTIGFGWQDPDGRWEGYWRFLAVNAPRPDTSVQGANGS